MKQCRGLRMPLILVAITCILLCLTACNANNGINTEDLCQAWYEEGTDWAAFTLYDDGTCETSSSYGEGNWEIVNENTLKLTDGYGDVRTWILKSISSDRLVLSSSEESQYEDVYWSSAEKSLAEAEKTELREAEEAAAEAATAPLEILATEDFHNDLAWVNYSQKGQEYWCCINKSGEAVFQYDASRLKYFVIGTAIGEEKTEFLDGYAYINTDDFLYMIDTTGQIIAQYANNSEEEIQCFGGGYVVTKKDISGFDAAGFQYTIYGRDGSVLYQFTNERDLDEYGTINYCGEGVIEFRGIGLFFAKTKEFKTETFDKTPVFQGSTAVVGTTYIDEGDTRKGGIILLTDTGDVEIQYSGYLPNWAYNPSNIIEDICVVYDHKNVMTFDISANESYRLDDQYSERLMWESPEVELHDGRIVLALEGADGNEYTGVFDKTLKMVFGPIEGRGGQYADGLLPITSSTGQDVTFYDVNGNVVYSLTDLGYKTSSTYSCGALHIESELYLDTDGNALFDKIDFSKVETKELPMT